MKKRISLLFSPSFFSQESILLNVPNASCSASHLELSPVTMVNRERYPSVTDIIPPLDILHASEAFRALLRNPNAVFNVTLHAKTLSFKNVVVGKTRHS